MNIKVLIVILLAIVCKHNTLMAQGFSALEVDKAIVKIDKNLYASKYEVSVNDWKKFIAYLKTENLEYTTELYEYKEEPWKVFPFTETDPFIKKYYTDTRNKTFPIVNIHFEAAEKYCEWLTKEYNAYVGKKKYKNVVFRLPTEDEWIKAAGTKGKNLPFKSKQLKNDKEQFHYSGKFIDEMVATGDAYNLDGYFYTANVNNTRFNNNNPYGLVHIFGNVAEMTQERGIAKGGHWASFAEEGGIKERYDYTEPDCRVGFRVFMEIKSDAPASTDEPKSKLSNQLEGEQSTPPAEEPNLDDKSKKKKEKEDEE